MRAVTCREGKLEVTDLPNPAPMAGQLVLDVLRCGICGSDLHARRHADAQADVLAESGYDGFARSLQSVVFGHEFVGTIAEHGPGGRGRIAAGTTVVAVPLVRRGGDLHPIGLSAAAPGAYAERVLVEDSLALPVPNGLAPDLAALTEPLAVGWHAVQRADIKAGDVAIAIGCGPVGLAVITMLKARGVRTVMASDLSPVRRALATTCGADTVVDPATDSPYTGLERFGHLTSMRAKAELGLETMDKLVRPPVRWHHVWRLADRLGVTQPKRPVLFECVGVPGMLEQIITSAPLSARVVVAGVCMKPDTIRPATAINKEIDLRFVVGYTPLEFRDTLHMLADGKVHAGHLVTGTVGLDGVGRGFDALAPPGEHGKILIDPRSTRLGA